MNLYLDACAIIYLIEGPPQFRAAVASYLAQAEARPGGVVMSSRLSRLECRVKPLRDNQTTALQQYDALFTQTPFSFRELTPTVIERATDLRAKHNFKTPDALHLATALENQADMFLTGDARLARCPALRVVTL